MNKTYMRKCRGGWKVVHVAGEQNNRCMTITAPLGRRDAERLRDTFRRVPVSEDQLEREIDAQYNAYLRGEEGWNESEE